MTEKKGLTFTVRSGGVKTVDKEKSTEEKGGKKDGSSTQTKSSSSRKYRSS